MCDRRSPLFGALEASVSKRRAYEAATPEARWRFQLAAGYTDERYFTHTTPGQVCTFRTFYLCIAAGAQYPCATIKASAHRARLNEDIFALGQRYFCNMRGAPSTRPCTVCSWSSP